MLRGRRVVVLGQVFAIWQPEVAPGVDHHVPALVVVDHGPVVDAKVVPMGKDSIELIVKSLCTLSDLVKEGSGQKGAGSNTEPEKFFAFIVVYMIVMHVRDVLYDCCHSYVRDVT